MPLSHSTLCPICPGRPCYPSHLASFFFCNVSEFFNLKRATCTRRLSDIDASAQPSGSLVARERTRLRWFRGGQETIASAIPGLAAK